MHGYIGVLSIFYVGATSYPTHFSGVQWVFNSEIHVNNIFFMDPGPHIAVLYPVQLA